MGLRHQPKRLAAKLLAIRHHLALSQSQLASKLSTDIHYGRVSEYELGRRVPGLLLVLRYAKVAKVPMESLVDDEVDLKF